MERLLILLRVLGIFIHLLRPFMSEPLYLHQTFTDCMSNYNTHVDMSVCQMEMQFMESFIILLRFLGIFIYFKFIKLLQIACSVWYKV